ncbi:FadD32-like long-chain-fatty-acid--AMP ligase [Corynebacterium casei]|uniref:FadD32-like long-chain-fatty-acid--AMP ligase n=1 Tax=Corynebacterium casei TaxID=160386 RepID=UPI0026479F96|nr:FadD32-like long-chain-fatty-acid--AMP ligase [Corynebacterium casei]MDN5705518.1 FadD32-like long-chain-fatty-acid--AMP ligase [Corynebacterium casei]MDN5729357.1 FadD32-like long-chain-fatty-acid--AMP ligase [Corynebacterium casei]MDN5740877.1 FadD32-like long-chain-fatty-acid--AMP ligase [Corynebacterium casei]MDN5901673.1 FadD32-like long-chain-fatty-acid--AMP ligase [Corynebacterium casei]MDN6130439.1 FadD32-like long-chain-fatty-acid--AMP ligase [Corynebacterium casei]
MDLHAAMQQFYNDKGEITLAPQLSLAGLAELLFQGDLHTGGGDRKALRFWDYSNSRDGELVVYTRQEINTRVKAVAARLQQVGKLNDRVAILAGNSPEYLFGFIGALYAGMVPVPLYDPNEPGHADHLRAVFADCQPKIVLTNSVSAQAVRTHFSELPSRERPRILSVDSLPDSLAESYVTPQSTLEGQQLLAMSTVMPIDQTAFLQYTSGSTRTPAGVELTNRSILTNVLQIYSAAKLKMPLRLVTWLPLHHDMGIILSLFVVIMGLPFEMMGPRDFIQQPKRWVDQLKRKDIDEKLAATYTVVPNFALELATRYGKPAEGEELDLSNLDGIIIGSEPVTQTAVENFYEVFKNNGLDRKVLRPSYGLAEASLLVSTPQNDERPVFNHFDREALAAGEAKSVEASENSVPFASNGQVVTGQYLTIVDPETRAEVADSVVGELWAHGENIAVGYLGREDETKATFRNTLGERLAEGSRVEGAPDDDKWMATGDLGTIIDGELYITGRLKDLIVIAGRNHYPQDIEGTIQEASDHVRPDSIAAFSVEGDNTEQLIVLIERADSADESGDEAATEAVRTAVSKNHGIVPDVIEWKAPHEINRTSSGKIARRVAKKNYMA